MKKSLLLAVSMLLTSVASFAQWVAPTYDGTAPEDGLQCYLYLDNTESRFMTGRQTIHSWSTTTGLSTKAADALLVKLVASGDSYIITRVSDNKETFISGWDVTSAEVPAFAEGKGWEMHVDKGNQASTYFKFVLKDPAKKTYTIHYDGADEEHPYSEGAGWGWYIVTPAEGESETPAQANVWANCPTNDPAYLTEWKFISEEEMEVKKEAAAKYAAAMKLDAAIKDAEAKYPGIDLSAPKTVYNNTSSTLEQLNDAIEAVNKAVKDYLINELKKATVSDPQDATGFIINPSFEDGNTNGWTVQNSSDTGAKENSNATYHCDNADGKYLFNIWDWGYPIKQNIKGLPQGIYKLQGMLSSSNDCTNVYLYADGNLTGRDGEAIPAAHKAVTLEGNPENPESKQTWLTEGELTFAVEGDSITIGAVGCDPDGVSYIENGKWWYKADNFRLTYYGNSDEAYQMWRQGDFGFREEVDVEATFAQQQLMEDYNVALADFTKNKTTAADILYAYKGILVLNDSLDANIKAYQAYYNEVESANKEMEDFEGEGDYVDLVLEYLSDIVNPGEAPSAEVEEEAYKTFPNGSYPYIEENKQLTTPQAVAETDYLTAMVTLMKNKTPYEGMDFTSSIVNHLFDDATGKGWTWLGKTKNDGGDGPVPGETGSTVGNLVRSGGLAPTKCAEAWRGGDLKFDVYQEVANVPDGIYSISANAFYRPNGKDDIDPENQKIEAYIYMNDFETPISHIGATGQGISEDNWEEKKQENVCGRTLDGTGWALANGVYYPDNMNSASQAFALDMYKQTVYGLVEGGQMRLGIKKSASVTGGNQWSLWTNFQLIYMGKNQDAVESVFNNLAGIADAILASDDASILNDEAWEALETAKEAEHTYENLIALNSAIKNARKAIDLHKQAEALLADLNNAIVEAKDGGVWDPSDPVIAEYEEYASEAEAGISEFTWNNAQLEEFVAKVPEMIARLSIAGDWTKADKEDPTTWVDLSSLFNSNFDAGNANGWTDTFTQGNHGYQQNNVYEGEDGAVLNKFIEAWRSGNTALEDAKFYTELKELPYSFLKSLPAGEYTLTADINACNQGDAEITGGAFLYVISGETETAVEVSATENGKPRKFSVDFTIEATTQTPAVELGVKTEKTGYNWIGADNFKLVIRQYESATGIGTVIADKTVISAPMMYNLAGQRINTLQKGLNIVDGKKILK